MRTLVVMAHYDPDGLVAQHVRNNVQALADVATRLVVVSTAALQPDEVAWLERHAELVRRDNYGYDFLSYKAGLDLVDDLTAYDRVVICNDSYVGPLVPYSSVLSTMQDRHLDFWGLTKTDRIAPHVQSFFVCFNGWLVGSPTFTRFWQRLVPLASRSEVIRNYEVGLTTSLTAAGFTHGSFFEETDEDVRVARRRMQWWAMRRSGGVLTRERRARWREWASEAWNPSLALADRCLEGGRLPYVKIDTLRYDPYGLGAQRLLTSCETRYPDQFSDVRAFLRRTDTYYPPRAGEVLSPLPLEGRLVRHLVRYA